jgi:replicative DNA helicase
MKNKDNYSIEAEQSVLGALLVKPALFSDLEKPLRTDEFYIGAHQIIYQSIVEAIDVNAPVDVVTIFERLERSEQADHVGGLAYLTDLVQNTPSVANVKSYSQIVRDRAIERELVMVANQIKTIVQGSEYEHVESKLDACEQLINQISEKRRRNIKDGPRLFDESILKSILKQIQEYHANPGEITGLSSGFKNVDDMTGGFQNEDLIIVAGRPSMGKTALAMNFVEHAAFVDKKKVLVFSIEMSMMSLGMRLVCSMSNINHTKMKDGKMVDHDWNVLAEKMDQIKSCPNLYIDETGGLTPWELRARARTVAQKVNGLDLVVVDYLQLMENPGKNIGNYTEEVSLISRALKGLAKELGCPVIALSQLNRSLESRNNKRPVNSDLRQSGAIEQDADVIMFVYRDEIYYPEDTPEPGVAEIIFGKQRNGPIGTVKLGWNGSITRFSNLNSRGPMIKNNLVS